MNTQHRPRSAHLIPAIGLVIALGGSIVVAAPVAGAAPPPYGFGPHSGKYGQHWILDDYGPHPESPAVTCRYDGAFKLKAVDVRRPVVLAYDRTNRVDHQTVGWKAVLQSMAGPLPTGQATSQGAVTAAAASPGQAPAAQPATWALVAETSVSRMSASDRYPADFLPKTFNVTNPGPNTQFRVVYKLLWYSSSGAIRGRASHRPYAYDIVYTAGSFDRPDYCFGSVVTAAPAPPFGYGAHTGKRGLHWILDNPGPYPEYPAVTCVYDDSGLLTKLRIQRPIVFAHDRTSHLDSQDVSWKADIQGAHADSGSEDWTPIGHTSPSTDSASERYWADFLPKSFPLDDDARADYQIVRVVYRLMWHPAQGPVNGRATHWPYWYGMRFVGTTNWSNGYCEVQVEPF